MGNIMLRRSKGKLNRKIRKDSVKGYRNLEQDTDSSRVVNPTLPIPQRTKIMGIGLLVGTAYIIGMLAVFLS